MTTSKIETKKNIISSSKRFLCEDYLVLVDKLKAYHVDKHGEPNEIILLQGQVLLDFLQNI